MRLLDYANYELSYNNMNWIVTFVRLVPAPLIFDAELGGIENFI
jgi:hypothetical protein